MSQPSLAYKMNINPEQYQFERSLPPGDEARYVALIRSQTGRRYVAKFSDPQLTFDELHLIMRANFVCPGVFPKITQAQFHDGAGYIMEHIDGPSFHEVYRGIKSHKNYAIQPLLVEALKKIRGMHFASSESYTSLFHNNIVVNRLRTIFFCPLIQRRADLLSTKKEKVDVSALSALNIKNVPEHSTAVGLAHRAISAYLQNLPTTESLIHGDPHFGNIMTESPTNAVYFIDPRCTWDGNRNSKLGYFDPLYDVAAIYHSLFANYNIIQDVHDKPAFTDNGIIFPQRTVNSFDEIFGLSLEGLSEYLERRPTESEKTRFIVYLACSLSGTMRYKIWTPTMQSLYSMFAYTCLVLNKVNIDRS